MAMDARVTIKGDIKDLETKLSKANELISSTQKEIYTQQEKLIESETKLRQARKEQAVELGKLESKLEPYNTELKKEGKLTATSSAALKVKTEEYKKLKAQMAALKREQSLHLKGIQAEKAAISSVIRENKTRVDHQKDFIKSQKDATKVVDSHSKSTENLANQTIRYLRWAGTIAGVVYAANRAWRATLGTGIEVNRMMEDNTSGIAALLSANTQMVLSNGQVVNSYDKFAIGQAVAAKTLKDLREASLETYATFPQLTEIFQQAIGQTLSMGDAFGSTVEDINKNTIKLSQRMSNIAGAIGMPMDRVREEIRSLLSGNASTDSLISTMLFGSPTEANKAIRMAKSRGKDGVTELFQGILEPFDVLAETETYTKNLLRLENAWSETMQQMSQPVFADLTVAFKDLANWLNENQDGIVEGFDGIYDSIQQIIDLVTTPITAPLAWLDKIGEEVNKSLFFSLATSPSSDIASEIKKVEEELADVMDTFRFRDKDKEMDKRRADSLRKYLKKLRTGLVETKNAEKAITEQTKKTNKEIEKRLKKGGKLLTKDPVASDEKEKGIITTSLNSWQKYYETIGDYENAWLIKQAQLRTTYIDLNKDEWKKMSATAKKEYFDKLKKFSLISPTPWMEIDPNKKFEVKIELTTEEKELQKLALQFEESVENATISGMTKGIQDAVNDDFNLDKLTGAFASSIGSAMTQASIKNIAKTGDISTASAGGLGTGIAMMFVGSQMAKHEQKKAEAAAKRLKALEDLKAINQKLLDQSRQAGTKVQDVFTKDFQPLIDTFDKLNRFSGRLTGNRTAYAEAQTAVKTHASALIDSIDTINAFSDNFAGLYDTLSGTSVFADAKSKDALATTYEIFGVTSKAGLEAELQKIVGVTQFQDAQAVKEGLAADISSAEFLSATEAIKGLSTTVVDAINNYDDIAEAVSYLNEQEKARLKTIEEEAEAIEKARLLLLESNNDKLKLEQFINKKQIIASEALAKSVSSANNEMQKLADSLSGLSDKAKGTITDLLLVGKSEEDKVLEYTKQFNAINKEFKTFFDPSGVLTDPTNQKEMESAFNEMIALSGKITGSEALFGDELSNMSGAIAGQLSLARDVFDKTTDVLRVAIEDSGDVATTESFDSLSKWIEKLALKETAAAAADIAPLTAASFGAFSTMGAQEERDLAQVLGTLDFQGIVSAIQAFDVLDVKGDAAQLQAIKADETLASQFEALKGAGLVSTDVTQMEADIARLTDIINMVPDIVKTGSKVIQVMEWSDFGQPLGWKDERVSVMGDDPGDTQAIATAKAERLSLYGFQGGGFTGVGRDDEVAGWVHKNEHVLPAPTTRAVNRAGNMADMVRKYTTPANNFMPNVNNMGYTQLVSLSQQILDKMVTLVEKTSTMEYNIDAVTNGDLAVKVEQT